ncbi:MAG: lysophospholipase L1-like esterase [Polaribacter sp.]|jgi:lysophospholipase L1-like esterase
MVLFSLFYLKKLITKNNIDTDIAGYIQSDQYPPSRKVNLLLGSSSILTLSSSKGLMCGPWLNRGIGSSHISDIVQYMNLTALAIMPAHIVIYAGENDLSEGKSIKNVFTDYLLLLNVIKKRYPASTVLMVSIKNSPKRQGVWKRFKSLNLRLKELATKRYNVKFLDISVLLDGNDKKLHYQKDGIHLNKTGMALFTNGINSSCEKTTIN